MTRRIPLVLARLLCVLFCLCVPVRAAFAAGVPPTVTAASVVKQDQAMHYLVQVSGANFTPTSIVTVNGTYLTSTYISPTQIQGVAALSLGATSISVAAFTQGVTGVSKAVVVPVSGTFKLTIYGSNPLRLFTTIPFNHTFSAGAPTDTALIWAVNGITGGNATVGTISTTGVYTPPVTLPAGTVTVSATSAAQPSVTATELLILQNANPQVNSRTATKVGNTLTFLVDLKGIGFTPGSVINAAGVPQVTQYLSPTELQANVVVPVGSSSLAVSISQPNPGAITTAAGSIYINQAITVAVTGPTMPRLGTTSTYTATIAGTANTLAMWQVNGLTGGTAQTGTITTGGVYTTPYVQPTVPVSITVVSAACLQCSGTLALAIQNPLPVIASASATQVAGATTFPIDVRGTGFTPDSVISANGAAISTTYVAPTELQGQVVVPSNVSTVALSVANPNPGAGASNTYTLAPAKVAITATAASRLLDQASFGPTVDSIQHVQQVGLSGYLGEQFTLAPTLFNPIGTPLPALCAADGQALNCAESDFWRVAVTGSDQLRQRVAFALSEIFVVAMPAVNGNLIPSYYNTLEKDAFGNFSTLLKDVTLTGGMGNYLNMLNSPAPAAGQHADENFAREMMQLFTIGPYELNADGTPVLNSAGQPVPAYTEDQVQAFARAYTGWTGSTVDGSMPFQFGGGMRNPDAPMIAFPAAHDILAKQLLHGVTLPAGQTPQQDLDGALSNLFQHPNVGPFLCRQLIQHLVTSTPSPAYVDRVAAVFANNGSGVRGDLKAVITAILMDAEARAGDTDATWDGGHLREPILLFANSARAFGFVNTAAIPNYEAFSFLSSRAGQRVLYAPSVFSYFRPEYVVPGTTINAPEFGLENTANAVLRMNALNYVVQNDVGGFNANMAVYTSLAAYPPDVVDTLGALLMHARMPGDMRTLLVNTIAAIPDHATRAKVAMYLVLTSPQYLILH